jgi:hypothetical protein
MHGIIGMIYILVVLTLEYMLFGIPDKIKNNIKHKE